ncbi:MAG: outer membrane lipoprotein carrier protein LolA [Gammaproteobacteria bacterium]|nr:outer membrane lipoprotein carrier protein LolA [Gammaproteobacteria bacterium]MCP5458511.1 outer membrane lipoprotein carrier protein LolA [Gammaproteobacteria bacterium]
MTRLLAMLLVVLCPVATAADWDLQQLMASLAKVPSVEARFEERKELAVLAEPLLLHGTLTYRAPHYLKKQTLQPYPETYEVDGDWLTIVTPEQRRNLYLPGHFEVGALVESIRATLAGDLATLKRYYQVRLQGSPSAWTLRLEPKESALRDYVSAIEMSGQQDRVLRMETLEASGDRSVVTITPLDE